MLIAVDCVKTKRKVNNTFNHLHHTFRYVYDVESCAFLADDNHAKYAQHTEPEPTTSTSQNVSIMYVMMTIGQVFNTPNNDYRSLLWSAELKIAIYLYTCIIYMLRSFIHTSSNV